LYLKKEGFCVVLLSNDKIFISWDIKDITEINNNKIKIKNDLSSIKPLLNIYK